MVSAVHATRVAPGAPPVLLFSAAGRREGGLSRGRSGRAGPPRSKGQGGLSQRD